MSFNKDNKNNDKTIIPLSIRIPSIVIIILGIIGAVFFLIVGLYEILNPGFLDSIIIEDNIVNNVQIYVFINLIINILTIVSSILILQRKIIGLYGIAALVICYFASEVIIGNTYGISYTLLYVIPVLLLIFQIKAFKKPSS